MSTSASRPRTRCSYHPPSFHQVQSIALFSTRPGHATSPVSPLEHEDSLPPPAHGRQVSARHAAAASMGSSSSSSSLLFFFSPSRSSTSSSSFFFLSSSFFFFLVLLSKICARVFRRPGGVCSARRWHAAVDLSLRHHPAHGWPSMRCISRTRRTRTTCKAPAGSGKADHITTRSSDGILPATRAFAPLPLAAAAARKRDMHLQQRIQQRQSGSQDASPISTHKNHCPLPVPTQRGAER